MIDRLRKMALAICAAALLTTPAASEEALSPAQKKAIEATIESYLLENPEIIARAIEALQSKREAAEKAAIQAALDDHRAALFNDPDSPTFNAGGDVTVIEFFDYRCGVCKRVHPIVAKLMKDDPKLRRVYKEWPILGPDSVLAARAALAARAQGKYFEFHDALMQARGRLDRNKVLSLADRIGLDRDRLAKDMESQDITAIIERNFRLADALKLNGTPSFVIGDQVVRGGRDLASMKELVAQARAGKPE